MREAISGRQDSAALRALLWSWMVLTDFLTSLPHLCVLLFFPREPISHTQKLTILSFALIGLLISLGFVMYGYAVALARHQHSVLIWTMAIWSAIALLVSGVYRYRQIRKKP